jgi:hypothetical protein
MTTDIDQRLLEQFIERLENWQGDKVRILLSEIQKVFDQIFVHRPSLYQKREHLLQALQQAETRGVIEFMKSKKHTDFTVNPPMPKIICLVRSKPPEREKWWKNYPWCDELLWLLDMDYVEAAHESFLKRVNLGFKEKWFLTSAAPKYRSIELTFDEKRLEELFKTVLFQKGRLTYESLNIISDNTPFVYQILSSQPIALVFENAAPYYLALRVLQNLEESPYGLVIFGGGNRFSKTIQSFKDVQESSEYQKIIAEPLIRIEYVGDLDWAGLRIAYDAATKAETLRLPPIVPAKGIHQAMLDGLQRPQIRQPDGFPSETDQRISLKALQWLPEDLRPQVQRILELGNRVPEEMLTEKVLDVSWTDKSTELT